MADPRDSTRRRRLAAILMADVAGFSKMMGRDEEAATARIIEFHEQVRATVEQYGGRVVGTAGDSVFGDFDSIVEALDCATEIQRSLHAQNSSVLEVERIDVRIGLHLGDVIVEEYNVFGDGVNIAARLEQLADPGGIVLSEAVYQQVRARSALPFEEMGTQSLKNIEQPIRLYRVAPDAFGGSPVEHRPAQLGSNRERSETGQSIRDAILRMVDKVEHEIDDAQREDGLVPVSIDIEYDESASNNTAVAAFNPRTLSVAAIGVLGLLARTSGWTDNAWYPFVGAWFLGIAVGRLLSLVTGRAGLAQLMRAAGVAVGAAFFGNVIMQGVLWVIAAGMLGGSIQALRRH